jgi:hypothetical protein
MKKSVRACVAVIVLLGIRATSFAQANTADHSWVRTEIYFGQTDRNNKPVNNAAWLRFVNRTLASEFRDGFTIIRGTGEWTDQKNHTYQEPSRVLIIVYPRAKAQAIDEAIRKVSSQFLRDFNEEAVLRVDSKAEVSFYR